MSKAGIILLFFAAGICLYAQKPDDHYLRGLAELQRKNYPEAVVNFDRSLAANVTGSVLLQKGKALYLSGNLQEALKILQLPEVRSEPETGLWLAKIYAAYQDTGNAVFYLQQYLSSDNKIDERTIKTDPAFDIIQYSDLWHQLWQNEWYTEDEKLISEVQRYIDKNDFDAAMALQDQLEIKASTNPDASFVLAGIYIEHGDYNRAVYYLNKAIDNNPGDYRYYLMRAEANAERQRLEQSVVDMNKAVELRPDFFELYKQRALFLSQTGDHLKAAKDIDFYLRYFPDKPEAKELAARIYAAGDDRLEALRYYNDLLANDKSKPLYFKERGRIYLETKTYKQAEKDLSMALDLDPVDGETYLLKGLARFYMEDREGACSDWKKAKHYGNTRVLEYILKYCRQ